MLVPGSVHFIIPSFEGEGTIKACLKSIFEQDYPQHLIWVSIVENGPKTNIKSLVSRFDRCTYHYNPVQGRSAARNFLLNSVEAEYIAYVDVDVVLSETWLEEVLATMTNSFCAAATGPVFRKGERWIDRYRRNISVGPNMMEVPGALGCMNTAAVLMKTSILKQVGGFDTTFKRCEDFELTHRLLRSGFVLTTTSTASADVYWERGYFEYFFIRFFEMGMYSAKAKYLHNIPPKIIENTMLFKLGYYFGKLRFSGTKLYKSKVRPKRIFATNKDLQVTVFEWNPEWEIVIIQNIVRLYNRSYGKFLMPFEDIERVIVNLLKTSFWHVEGPQNEGLFNKMIQDQILVNLNLPKVLVNQVFDDNIRVETSLQS